MIDVGFSPCPNDTFLFSAWVHGQIEDAVPTAPSPRPWLADIERLNRRACGPSPLPVSKISAAVLAQVADRYAVAVAGAALGRGCGPLVVVPEGSAVRELEDLVTKRVAIPGESTTAALLLRRFGPEPCERVAMRFDEIMPALARSDSGFDAGVIIHESRFTFSNHGLRAVADLGVRWEDSTGLPLPLGVMVVQKDLGSAHEIVAAIRASAEHALADPRASADYVRANAQEMDPSVCDQHIALYVNEFSIDLGPVGRVAIEELVGAKTSGLEWLD